jgi:thioredoxin 2
MASTKGVDVDMSSRIVICQACSAKNRTPESVSGRPRCAKCKADLPWIVDAADATLSDALATNSLVLVDLWAPWCGPCRQVAPVLERLAGRYSGRLKVVKINVDDNPMAARTYDASSIPTLVMVRDGKVVGRVVGAQPEPALASQIEPLLPVSA